ncbi:MAG: hypothetical protein IKG94_00715, partial [Candidatus Methanomethylophilaceae archaeon]|nr:hypothetical protein [Candidatus Methanomethylophilaceae archaeon]
MDVKLSRMIALAVLAFVLMIATVPYSEGATVSTTIDGAGYNLLDDGTATYTKAPSSTASVTVPSTVTYSGTTYTVTTIGSSAFTKTTTVASIAQYYIFFVDNQIPRFDISSSVRCSAL